MDTLKKENNIGDEIYEILKSRLSSEFGIDLSDDRDAEGDWNELIDDFILPRIRGEDEDED